MKKINIGKDFSPDPSGRYYSDSTSSGEAFREKLLMPALRDLLGGEKITVILDDGVETYGSSFLTEGFANIVKYGYMTPEELIDRLIFEYRDSEFSFFEKKILQYIKESKFNSKKYVPTKI